MRLIQEHAPVVRLFIEQLIENEETISHAYEQGKIVTVKLKAKGAEHRVLNARIEIGS